MQLTVSMRDGWSIGEAEPLDLVIGDEVRRRSAMRTMSDVTVLMLRNGTMGVSHRPARGRSQLFGDAAQI
jgi:hypothetical protein